MKKNQLIILGTIGAVLLLFLMLIYRSSGGYTNQSDTTISIRIQEGIQLPSSYSDSLLELLDIYESETTEKTFSQSKLVVYKNDGTSIEIAAAISGMNQLRSVFSSSFYTFEERKSDLLRLKQNSNQFLSNFRNNSNLPDGEDAIKITCTEDSNGNFQPAIYINKLKKLIQSKIFSGQYDISIYFTLEELDPPSIDEPVDGPDGPDGPDDTIITDPETGEDNGEDGDQSGPKIVCKANDVNTVISFEPGLPNVFTWTEQDGYTYDFTLSCTRGDCSNGLSVNRANITGGSLEVEATYAEATEKKYTATLVVKCNGKVLKTISKVVKLVCA
jgi:hypothetical protein